MPSSKVELLALKVVGWPGPKPPEKPDAVAASIRCCQDQQPNPAASAVPYTGRTFLQHAIPTVLYW